MSDYNFFNRWGGVNAHPNTPNEYNENSVLYTLELFLLGLAINQHDIGLEKMLTHLIGEKLYNKKTNMFNNIAHEVAPDNPDRFISHDNLTAIAVFSKLIGATWHEKIFKEIKLGTYDNISGKFNPMRVLHPRDYIFYGILAGDPWCKIMSPILEATGYLTFKDEYKVRNGNKIVKTDNELLWWCRFHVYSGSKSLRKYAERRIIERFGTWNNVFRTYFKHIEHPIRKIVDRYPINMFPEYH